MVRTCEEAIGILKGLNRELDCTNPRDDILKAINENSCRKYGTDYNYDAFIDVEGDRINIVFIVSFYDDIDYIAIDVNDPVFDRFIKKRQEE